METTLSEQLGAPVGHEFYGNQHTGSQGGDDPRDEPAFKKWFGESKITSTDGTPKVVYHGTGTRFDDFKRSEVGRFGSGVYFTEDPKEAKEYAESRHGESRVVQAYLSMKNPFVHDPSTPNRFFNIFGKEGDKGGEATARAIKAGYDGIIGVAVPGVRATEYVVFDPEQVKQLKASTNSEKHGAPVGHEFYGNQHVASVGGGKTEPRVKKESDPQVVKINGKDFAAVKISVKGKTGWAIAGDKSAQYVALPSRGTAKLTVYNTKHWSKDPLPGLHLEDHDGVLKVIRHPGGNDPDGPTDPPEPRPKTETPKFDATGDLEAALKASLKEKPVAVEKKPEPYPLRMDWKRGLRSNPFLSPGAKAAEREHKRKSAEEYKRKVAAAMATKPDEEHGAPPGHEFYGNQYTGSQGGSSDERYAPGDPRREEKFQKWFDGSKVVDDTGKPKVVYHGTGDSFTKFDIDESVSEVAFFMTDDKESAEEYAYRSNKEYRDNVKELDKSLAELAKEWEAHDLVMTLEEPGSQYYFSNLTRQIDNYVRNGGDKEKALALNKLASRTDDLAIKVLDYDHERWDNAANVMPVFAALKNPKVVDGTHLPYWQMLRQASFKAAADGGHDGIIFKNVVDNASSSERRSNVYVAFKPSQIKSAIGNKGTFDPKDDDIRHGAPVGHEFYGNQHTGGGGDSVGTKEEFAKANPHALAPGTNAVDRGRAFDKLPDSAMVWVFHATDRQTADKILENGISKDGKPRTLASERFGAGEDATFSPGNGLGRGTYVGASPASVEGYGRKIIAFQVRKGDVQVPPEGKMLNKTPGLALADSDAMVSVDIPKGRILDVSESQYEFAYEAIVKAKERDKHGAPVGHEFYGNQHTGSHGGDSKESDRIPPGDPRRDANFKSWFGESKITDASGAPLQLYHGTTKDVGNNLTGKYSQKDSGIYLTPDPMYASGYASNFATKMGGKFPDGGKVLPVFAKIEKPAFALVKPEPFDEKAIADLKAKGHDGLIVGMTHYEFEIGDPITKNVHEIVVFDSKQVKSSKGNKGTFNPEDDDIRHSAKEETDMAEETEKLGAPAGHPFYGNQHQGGEGGGDSKDGGRAEVTGGAKDIPASVGDGIAAMDGPGKSDSNLKDMPRDGVRRDDRPTKVHSPESRKEVESALAKTGAKKTGDKYEMYAAETGKPKNYLKVKQGQTLYPSIKEAGAAVKASNKSAKDSDIWIKPVKLAVDGIDATKGGTFNARTSALSSQAKPFDEVKPSLRNLIFGRHNAWFGDQEFLLFSNATGVEVFIERGSGRKWTLTDARTEERSVHSFDTFDEAIRFGDDIVKAEVASWTE